MSNEAAERLLEGAPPVVHKCVTHHACACHEWMADQYRDGFVDLRVAERRATVERIRAEALGVGYTHIENVDLFAILDAEEAR